MPSLYSLQILQDKTCLLDIDLGIGYDETKIIFSFVILYNLEDQLSVSQHTTSRR